MKRSVVEKRWKGIERARELLDTAQIRQLTDEEIQELKNRIQEEVGCRGTITDNFYARRCY